MKAHRILFILHLPPPVHGASLSNLNLVNSKLIRDNYEMDIVNFQFSSSMEQLKKFSIIKIIKSIKYFHKIINRIINQKPDLVYYTISPAGYAFYRDALYILTIKLFKLKIVLHLHGKGIEKSTSHSKIKQFIYKSVFKNCEIICLTNNLANDIKHISSAVPFIIPYGIPIVNKGDKTHQQTNSKVRILYLSNYVKTKGILNLIDALERIKKMGYSFHARLVGDPTDLSVQNLNEYVKHKNLQDDISIVGPKFNNDKYLEFQNTDIFVFPTYYFNEAQPLVNLEAMQFNLPIISTYEGGIPETVINNETGFIIEGNNIHELSCKIETLITNHDLRTRMGKYGYKRFIENYTLEHFENKIHDTFQKIIKTA